MLESKLNRIDVRPQIPGRGSCMLATENGLHHGNYGFIVTQSFIEGEYKWVLNFDMNFWGDEEPVKLQKILPFKIDVSKEKINAFVGILQIFLEKKPLSRITLDSDLDAQIELVNNLPI